MTVDGLGGNGPSGETVDSTIGTADASTLNATRRIADGPTVYVGSWDETLYAVDAATGEPVWAFTEVDRVIASSPTVVDGTLYVGSHDRTLYAVDARTGESEWTFAEFDGPVESSPTVVDGAVFVGSGDETLYAVDAATGEQLWAFTEPEDDVISTPAVSDGTVYVGSNDWSLYAVDAETGEHEWTFAEPDGWIDSSPTVVDGVVYVGSRDETLYAVDATTGERLWSFTQPDVGFRTTPTVAAGTLYLANDELYAVDAETGESVWTFTDADTVFGTSPTVSDGTVFAGDTAGSATLYAVDAETAELIWAFDDVDSGEWYQSSPTVYNGTVYVGASDTNLYAVDAETGQQEWAFSGPGDWVHSSPTVVADPEAGDSVGSRVRLGTLGHHHELDTDDATIDPPDDPGDENGDDPSDGPGDENGDDPPDAPADEPPDDNPVEAPEYDLEAGDAREVDVGYDSYLLIDDIPDRADDRLAVTKPSYEVVSPSVAKDVLVVDQWQESRLSLDWEEERDRLETLREDAERNRLFGRAVDAGWSVTEILVFYAAGSPKGSVSSALDLATDAIGWRMEAVDRPYRETFQQLAACLDTVDDVTTLADDLESTENLGDDLQGWIDLAMDFHTGYQAGASLAEASSEFYSALEDDAGFADAAAETIDAPGAKFLGVAGGLALGATFGSIDDVVETKTTIHGIEHAYASMAIPVVDRLAELDERFEAGNAVVGDVVAYNTVLLQYYQMRALAFHSIGEHWRQIADARGRTIWNPVANAEEKAGTIAGWAENDLELAGLSQQLYGFAWSETEDHLEGSVNEAVFDGGAGS